MNAKNDFFLFVTIIIVLFFAWVYSGGPERAISREGLFLKPPPPIGSGSAYNIPGINSIRSVSINAGGSIDGEDASSAEDGGGEVKGTFESIFGFLDNFKSIKSYGEVSPYRGKIILGKGTATANTPSREYITLSATTKNTEQVNITGWRLESVKSGVGARIPVGAYLPYSGQVNDLSDILLVPGGVAHVVTGRSPVGSSFRTNGCTGYFEQFQDFTPNLKKSCPSNSSVVKSYPDRSQFNAACEDFIDSLGQCTLAVNAIPSDVDQLCRNFILNELSYAGCVDNNKNNANFYTKEWYVYLGYDGELWKSSKEVIVLTDAQGKVVDALTY
jgi:hypothetical protein